MKFEELNMFAEEQLIEDIYAVERGRHDSTMYFLIPKIFRKFINPRKDYPCNLINCKRSKYLVIKLK